MNEDIEASIREITLPVLIARYGTQMEIARLCGISQGCVSRWRYGVPQHHARMFVWMERAERAEEGPDDWETGEATRTVARIAAEAYQVVGALASQAGLFEDDAVERALDYFGDIANGEPGARGVTEILPWGIAEDRGNG